MGWTNLSTVTITVWRCWYTRVTQLTGFGLRSICTPPGPWSALTFSSGVIADWALWAWHVRFLYYFRRKLNLGEHRGHCLVTALRLIRQEQARDIQNYVILCLSCGILLVSLPQQYQVNIHVSWDITPRRLVNCYRYFWEAYCLHLDAAGVGTALRNVGIYQSTRCNIPGDLDLYHRRYGNFISQH